MFIGNDARVIQIRGESEEKIMPDYVFLSLTIESKERKYAEAVDKVGLKTKKLCDALAGIGFDAKSIQTEQYQIMPRYNMVKEQKGKIKTMVGYECTHRLRLGFDYEVQFLAKVLSAIAECFTEPKVDVQFSVKDEADVKDRLLKATAENARRKAEILCAGAGATLGHLRTVEYSCSNLSLECIKQPQRYDVDDHMNTATLSIEDMTPKEIIVSDSAEFAWDIE